VGTMDNGNALIASFIGCRAAEDGRSREGRQRRWNFNDVDYRR
jgi:hypothetical protein